MTILVELVGGLAVLLGVRLQLDQAPQRRPLWSLSWPTRLPDWPSLSQLSRSS